MTEHASYKQRVQVHTLRELGWTYLRIAQHLDLTERQVRYIVSQPATPRKRSGRPSVITTPQRRELVDFVIASSYQQRMPYFQVVQGLNWGVSEDTIRAALVREGLNRCVARAKPS